MEHHFDCKYLGSDMWDCGHVDNCQSDEPCDCDCCRASKAVDEAESDTDAPNGYPAGTIGAETR